MSFKTSLFSRDINKNMIFGFGLFDLRKPRGFEKPIRFQLSEN